MKIKDLSQCVRLIPLYQVAIGKLWHMCEYIILEDFKLDKYIYDENNGLWYELQGDYYLPCLTLPPEEEKPIGIWGQRHKRYLEEHRKATYTTLLTSGKLNTYLADINEQAENMFFRLVKQMAECEEITEQMKAENQIEWVRRMNNIQNRAREVVNAELIYN